MGRYAVIQRSTDRVQAPKHQGQGSDACTSNIFPIYIKLRIVDECQRLYRRNMYIHVKLTLYYFTFSRVMVAVGRLDRKLTGFISSSI